MCDRVAYSPEVEQRVPAAHGVADARGGARVVQPRLAALGLYVGVRAEERLVRARL